ncbi:MAG: DUF2784 domain-containing protein [Alphaproteobacteria bacterium]|nr:DUF2784 domain-containing protein [Alphaproteobacteria bacterium]
MPPDVAAEAVLVLHALYVGVVVLGVPFIVIGAWRRWRWVRDIRFRLIHLLMIAAVAAESFLGINCPLTVWERRLRAAASPTYKDQDFIAAALDRILFYAFPHWVFTLTYALFGLLVVALFFIVPVKRKGKNANE